MLTKIAAGCLALALLAWADGPVVWFCPLDPLLRPEVGYSGSPQYMSLFSPEAEWTTAAGRVQVFKIYPQWIGRASDADLQTMFADLNRRGIALALEYGVLTQSAECGTGVEGFGGRSLLDSARRIKRNGGVLRFVAMDEPIFFSTIYTGKNACGWTVQQMAANAAVNIRAMKAEFPDVEIGDIEPVPPPKFDAWLERFAQGMDAFREALGSPLAFFHADVLWSAPWREAVDGLRKAAAERGIPFGMIYNGDGSEQSDAAWVRDAEQHMVDNELGSDTPEHVIFQSWHAYPKKLLPETDGDSFTHLINRYFRQRSALDLQREGEGLKGTLTTAGGTPLPGSLVTITSTPTAGAGVAAEYVATGIAPTDAAAVVVGFRVNLECGCSGTSEFTVSKFRYEETDEAGRVIERDFSQGLQGWGLSNAAAARVEGASLRVSAAADQQVLLNSRPLEITPGAAYRFIVSARVAPVSAGSGYFTVIFLSEREISRVRLAIAAASLELGSASTDREGRWEFALPDLGDDPVLIRALYSGSEEYWPARAELHIRPCLGEAPPQAAGTTSRLSQPAMLR